MLEKAGDQFSLAKKAPAWHHQPSRGRILPRIWLFQNLSPKVCEKSPEINLFETSDGKPICVGSAAMIQVRPTPALSDNLECGRGGGESDDMPRSSVYF